MIRVLVLDAYSGSGSMIGKATLQALVTAPSSSSLSSSPMEICAAVQDPSQLNVDGVVKQFGVPASSENSSGGDNAAAQQEEWSKLFESFHRIFVVTPKIQDPVPFTKTVIDAASKMNNLELLLMTSDILAAGNPKSTLVGQQCHVLEEYAKVNLEKKCCIVRIPSSPLWIDNLAVYAHHIRDQHSLLDPRDATKPFWTVALSDVASACATILKSSNADNASKTELLQYQQNTFDLVSASSLNLHDLASMLTRKLGVDRPIQTTRVSYEDTKKGMMKYGMPEWQVDSVLQMFQTIDAAEDNGVVAGAVERITGQKSTTAEDWIDRNISHFE